MNKPQLRLELDSPVSPDRLWTELLHLAEERLGTNVVQSWLRPARALEFQDGVLTIGTPSASARDWIEKKYAQTLTGMLADLGSTATGVHLVVAPAARYEPRVTIQDTLAADRREPRARSHPQPPAKTSPARPGGFFAPTPLNDRYDFDHFVVGPSNRFAQAAAQAVVSRPGQAYNPLFIYGATGLGKTHLLQAIGHRMRQGKGAGGGPARVAYVSGETFTSHFVASLRESREDEFKRAYRTVDVWLVDDIQFVADKTSTREEFFHTFNELYLTNRQIVLASDRPPDDLRLMEDRLRSRLASGLMAEIGAPELETRMAIVEQRAQSENAELPAEVVLTIAQLVESNIRALEAALIRVLALASLNRSALTAEMASEALVSFIRGGRLARVTVQSVEKAVCQEFGIAEMSLSMARDQQTTRARRVAMYLMRELTRHSLSEIGDLFGGKTHSTVVYACQKLEREMKADRDLSSAVKTLCARLKTG